MANVLKKLAGETAIYGLSTILARMLNFLIVPLYTRVLATDNYGAYTEIMSYIAVLQVVLALGLETGCFRFASNSKDSQSPFSTALFMVVSVSLLFFGTLALFATPISNAMGYEGYSKMVIYSGGILALDSICAILFARLRFMQKAFKFAIFKTVKIVSELGFNLMLFLVMPAYLASTPNSFLLDFIPATPDFSYIIFAVFLSCVVCMLLFIPDLIRVGVRMDKNLLRQMLVYSLPLMIAGLPGIVNESLDRILFRFFAPQNTDWRADLGIYQAAVKLAVIMNLFVQMFRYAAEPFFFSREKDKDSKVLYAKVMEYFVAFCMLIFLGIIAYMDIIGLILGRDFRGALDTVPFMLISYMIIGVLFNVSMWYKLSGHTRYAINITLAGLAVTTLVNVALMPYFSYWASVWAHVLSGLVMLGYSLWLGNRYYPIPYNWKRIGGYVALGLGLFVLFSCADKFLASTDTLSGGEMMVARIALGTLAVIGYMAYVVYRNRDLLKRTK
jgi:O-antigen/teichoic acid export membrane protein